MGLRMAIRFRGDAVVIGGGALALSLLVGSVASDRPVHGAELAASAEPSIPASSASAGPSEPVAPTPATPEASPVPSQRTSFAGIVVWKHIDKDGRTETVEDHEWPRSWQFDLKVDDDVVVSSADPLTRGDEPARWTLDFQGDSTRVTLTEIPKPGYRLIRAWCFDADTSDGPELPATLVGNSLSFNVWTLGETEDVHGYFCNFYNSPEPGPTRTPGVTLPPTDTSPARPFKEPG